MGEPRQLANWVTGSRIVLVLLAYPLLLASPRWPALLPAAFVLYVFGEMSDLLDGDVARRTGSVSQLGSLLDPMADSIFRFLLLLALARLGWAPFWLVPVFFLRDICVAYARILGAGQGRSVAARQSGKIKAMVQFGYVFILFTAGLLASAPALRALPDLPRLLGGMALAGLALLVPCLLYLKVRRAYLLLIAGFAVYVIALFALLALPGLALPAVRFAALPFQALAVVTAAVTLWSGLDYGRAFLRVPPKES